MTPKTPANKTSPAKVAAARAPKKEAAPKRKAAPLAPAEALRPRGRPLTLPGLLGALAEALGGLETLSVSFDPRIPTRTIRQWADNTYVPSGFDSGRVRDLCQVHDLTPLLYHHPTTRGAYVASTPEGWQTWALGGRGWFDRRLYKGTVSGLRLVSDLELKGARLHGWPW